ncbi:unnamed protein product [Paramecium pentaurelia]|uniref:Uncharacterized protein n=1 Tax=Paramecium pentaurelia TaxID=43138 RepID=A0A8S1XKT7_9CILI|nr:unnamed protein product [Paramecium pentaurelia]
MQAKRIVLITGANRGLGLKLAEVLAEKYSLILTARKQDELERIKENLEKKFQNLEIRTHQLDVSNKESVANLKDWLVQQHLKIDVLVNNAGVSQNPRSIIDINVIGTIDVSEQLLTTLTEDGKILLVSSILGKLNSQPKELKEQLQQKKTKEEIIQLSEEFIKKNDNNLAVYSASKAILNAYGRYVLSGLVKPNQSIYCMHPGWIKTDMGGPQAPGSLDDGVVTSQFLINNLPFQRDEKYHGKYFNDKAQVEDF